MADYIVRSLFNGRVRVDLPAAVVTMAPDEAKALARALLEAAGPDEDEVTVKAAARWSCARVCDEAATWDVSADAKAMARELARIIRGSSAREREAAVSDAVIAARPPDDGREWDCQCARCGSSVASDDCWQCGGDGFVRWDEDDEDEVMDCDACDGSGTHLTCLSDAAWCEAHPLPGRELTGRGALEWYVVERGGDRG